MREALVAWLRRLFLRRSSRSAAAVVSAADGDKVAAPSPLASVRELYRQLLGLGESMGVVRRADTTPLEHVPALSQRLEPPDLLEDLTDAYVRVRYAEQPPVAEDVDALRERLAQVQPQP
jgi:hypothetical protein